MTPLLIAIESGHAPTVVLLIDKGANFFKKNRYGFLPVQIAHAKGNVDMVDALSTAMIQAGRRDVLDEALKKPE